MSPSPLSFVQQSIESVYQAVKKPPLIGDIVAFVKKMVRENQSWGAERMREATPFGEAPQYLIRDNDRKYGKLFARVASGTGIQVLRTPYGPPRANAVCERLLGGVRRECLDHFLILGERHLQRVMKEYGEYFNHARPHQGLGQRIPCRLLQGAGPSGSSQVVSRPVLGGLHHNCQWRAAERSSYLRAA